MDLILLPGLSKKNLEWINNVAKECEPRFNVIKAQYYQHWEKSEEAIDIKHEEKVLLTLAHDLSDYMIFGKSVGAILAIRAISHHRILPLECVFVGTAINWARANHYNIDTWLEDYSIPTLFIQNTLDPAISFQELNSLLQKKKARNHTMIKIEGNTHNYDEIKPLVNLMLKFMQKH